VALAISLGFGVAVLDNHLLNSCQYGSKVRDTVTMICRFVIRYAVTAGQCALMQHEPWQIKAGVGRNTQAPKFLKILKTASQCFSVARPLGIALHELLAVVVTSDASALQRASSLSRSRHQKILFG